MSDRLAAPAIVGLSIGVAFLVIFSIYTPISYNVIPTSPLLSVEQALPAARDYLDAHMPEILWPLEGRKEEKLDTLGLLQLPNPDYRPAQLVYVHHNGTQFLINQTDHISIIGKCDLADQDLCYTGDRDAQDAIEGHLIYVLEAEGKVREGISAGGKFFVDANYGRLLYPR